MDKRLTKSNDKMLTGICGGVADYYEKDPTLIRVIYAAVTVFSGFVAGIVLYIILSIIIPNDNAQ